MSSRPHRSPARRRALLGVLLLAATGCGQDGAAPERCPDPAPYGVKVLATYPHDDGSYTQGLEQRDGVLYESAGRYGRSDVRVVEPRSGVVRRQLPLPKEEFAEGLTFAGDTLWQLTWKEGVAYARDPRTLAVRRTVRYQGDGWGLCFDAARDRLVMTDGGDRLVFRDPTTFARLGHVDVTEEGRPLSGVNELECTEDGVWGNVYPTPRLVRVDAEDGRVTATATTTGLDAPEPGPGATGADVVANGIAQVSGTKDEFWLTGKLWPRLYRVRLSPPQQCR